MALFTDHQMEIPELGEAITVRHHKIFSLEDLKNYYPNIEPNNIGIHLDNLTQQLSSFIEDYEYTEKYCNILLRLWQSCNAESVKVEDDLVLADIKDRLKDFETFIKYISQQWRKHTGRDYLVV